MVGEKADLKADVKVCWTVEITVSSKAGKKDS